MYFKSRYICCFVSFIFVIDSAMPRLFVCLFVCFVNFNSIHSVTKCYRLTVLLLFHLVLFYQRADVLY